MRKKAAKISGFMTFIMSLFCLVTASAQEIRSEIKWFPARSLYMPDTLTICFTGDIMMHSRQMEFDFSGYFKEMEHIFKAADIMVGNMEFPLAGEPHSGYPQFSAPDIYAEYVAESGVDIFLCANNHILDKGSAGAERTLEQYRKLSGTHGIRFTGAAGSQEELESTTPLIVETKGVKIAFINFTYGTNLGSTKHWPKINYMNQKEFLRVALQKAKEEADLTIVLPHWGEEYQLIHSENQENMACWLVENGADMIIGTHPHVVQDTGSINGVPVAYSLGNAVSNMSAPNTQIGMTMTAKFSIGVNGRPKLESFAPTYTWCSRPGGFGTSYAVIPVEDQIGKRDGWIGDWEYDKMVTTYERIRKTHNK